LAEPFPAWTIHDKGAASEDKNMRTIFFTILLFIFVFSLSVFGQVQVIRPTAARPRVAEPADYRQWEYLVLSVGKVYFSDPVSEADAKTSGLSRLLTLSKQSIVITNEAIAAEKKLDTLGKFGWELVSVVGAIGGEQEMVFKRAYTADRARQDEELINQESERVHQLLAEERTKAARLAEAPSSELLDLDELELVAARDLNRQAQEDKLIRAVEAVEIAPVTIKSIFSTATSTTDTKVEVDVVVDVTETMLTEANTYRGSDAKKLTDQIAAQIKKNAGIKDTFFSSSKDFFVGDVKISVAAIIIFRGKERVVATSLTGGEW
jgi:hypothetical protein